MTAAEKLDEPQLTTITEYSVTAAALATLKHRMQGLIYDVSTTKGMEIARKDRAEIKAYRIALEAKRVEIKAPALERCQQIDTEAKRIKAELEALEAIPDAAIKAEEARKEREKEAKVAAEVARVAAIHERIAELRGNQLLTPASGSQSIAGHITDLEAIDVGGSFAEFTQLAVATKAATLERLTKLLEAAQAHEAEQARITAERAELERQRAEQAEADRVKREQESAERAAAKAKHDAEVAAERARLAAEEAEAKRVREAADLAAAVERKRLADEHEAKLQQERAEAERVAREQQARIEQERRDADERMRQINAEAERLRAEREENERAAKEERDRLQAVTPLAGAIVELQPTEELVYSTDGSVRVFDTVTGHLSQPIGEVPNADTIAGLVASRYGVDLQKAFAWCKAAFDTSGAT